MKPLRILLGPLVKTHPEAVNILETLSAHELLTYATHDADVVYDYPAISFQQILNSLPEGWTPDIVFFLSPEYQGMPRGIEDCPYPLVATVADWNLGFHAVREIAGFFDLILTDRPGVEIFRNAGFSHVERAKLFGFVPKEHYRIPEIEPVYDISIVGNLRHEVQRERSLWLARVARLSDRYRVNITSGLYGEAYTRTLNQSRITFNRSIRGEMNMRAYEAPACGSLMFFEDSNREVRDIYEDRVHCVLYNEQNLEELLEFYLTHENERIKIVEAAHERVQDYTIGRQWERIVDFVSTHRMMETRSVRAIRRVSDAAKRRAVALQALQCATPGGSAAAKDELTQLCSDQPENADALNSLGVVLSGQAIQEMNQARRSECFQIAGGLWSEAARLQPDNGVIAANLGLLKRPPVGVDALDFLRQAVQVIQDTSAEALANTLYHPRTFDSFRVEHERIVSEYSGDMDSCGNALRDLYLCRLRTAIAEQLTERGEWAAAIDEYRLALLTNDSGSARLRLAAALDRMGLDREAVEELRHAVALEPFLFEAREELCRKLASMGCNADLKAAREDALQLIQACPNYLEHAPRFSSDRFKAQTDPSPTVSLRKNQPNSMNIDRPYRILTFNWHEPYLATICKTAHQFDVVTTAALNRGRIDGISTWDERKRPIPPNVALLSNAAEILRRIAAGSYDLAICFTIHDLRFLYSTDLPRIFCPLSSPKNDLAAQYENASQREAYAAQLRLASRGATVVYTTEEMGTAALGGYDLTGSMVGVAVDEDDYNGYTGEEAVALRVGNCLAERWFLNYGIQQQVLEGFPRRILGVNPSIPESRPAVQWDDLRENYRRCRLFFHSFVKDFQEAPAPMSVIEAMATGMPVVSTEHPLSLIRDGVNGFVSDNIATLRERVSQLLEDRELAVELGRNARETVVERYGIQPFVAAWNNAFKRCLDGNKVNQSSSPTVVEACPQTIEMISGLRASNYLYAPEQRWEDSEWKPVIKAFANRFTPDDPTALVIDPHIPAALTDDRLQEIAADIQGYLDGCGIADEQMPEMILLDAETSREYSTQTGEIFTARVRSEKESTCSGCSLAQIVVPQSDDFAGPWPLANMMLASVAVAHSRTAVSNVNPWIGRTVRVISRPELPGLVEVNGVRGFLTPGDMALLSNCARAVPRDGAIVEIGSFMGLSTILMAAALISSENAGARIYCIDTWEGSPEHQVLPEVSGMQMFDVFQRNIDRAEVSSLIHPIQAMSTEVAGRFALESIDLLFVDGDHTFEGCYKDLELYYPRVKPGGRIIGHDCIPGGTVERAVSNFCRKLGLTYNVHDMPVNHYMFEIKVPAKLTPETSCGFTTTCMKAAA